MNTTYISKIETINAGGGSMVDLITLHNGQVIAMNDECIAVYKNEAHFYEVIGDANEETPVHAMYY
jgi:hypothetical protein